MATELGFFPFLNLRRNESESPTRFEIFFDLVFGVIFTNKAPNGKRLFFQTFRVLHLTQLGQKKRDVLSLFHVLKYSFLTQISETN